MATPKIACIAIIGKKVSYSLSPPASDSQFLTQGTSRDRLAFHFLIHTTLDIFASRLPAKTNGDSDFGLLYSVDEGLALYGWLTNTGIKFVIAVETPSGDSASAPVGLREGEMKGVFRALQTAYIRLVCNPFYDNDESGPIESKRFLGEVEKIAVGWTPSVVA
ncbi:Sedlin, N-terminal conserved region-domain-containing protein [Geopyxis carbonaria]|nr:Sedlin, N-terminal conserved region-domain-containing protein [Geopyxis carbonaria]